MIFAQYHIIAWANITEQPQITNPNMLTKVDITIQSDDKGSYRGIDSLYRAELPLDLRHVSQGGYIVPFPSVHVGLDIVVKGYDALHPDTGEPRIEIPSDGTHCTSVEHPAGIFLPDVDKTSAPILGHS